MNRSLYLTLGCRVVDDNDGLRLAFHALAKRYHPDRVGPNGTPFLREIAEAYKVLSDFERRNTMTLAYVMQEKFLMTIRCWSPVWTECRLTLLLRLFARLWIPHK